jgi:hypothetical protein
MLSLQLALCAALVLAPTAAALPEPARSAVDDATFHCYRVTLGEAERREAQADALAGGEVPYRLARADPNDPIFAADPRPTAVDVVDDTTTTVMASDEAMLETACVLIALPDPVTPPDVTGLLWRLVEPILCAQIEEC